jgi:glycosyltransferase involved in cell wall biosynthesis
MRILHAVGGMNRGGTEMLVMNVLRNAPAKDFQFDVLVRERKPGAFDHDVKKLGVRIIPCPHEDGSWPYIRRLKKILHDYGPYDVVHSHTHFFDGLILAVAATAGVPVRISHSHTTRVSRESTPLRLLQSLVLKTSIRRCATHRVAVSEASYRSLFGAACDHTERSKIIRNGVDMTAFGDKPGLRSTVRKELGIPEEVKVLGHVGRFDKGKNHAFLLACFDELCRHDDRWRMVLVGDGPLRRSIMDRAVALNRCQKILDLGERDDVDRVLEAMDAFAFPSLYEGFGIALLEAQAHGLPCLVSSEVPAEADAGLGLVTFMDLSAGPAAWALAVAELGRGTAVHAAPKVALAKAGYDMLDRIPEWLELYAPSPRRVLL